MEPQEFTPQQYRKFNGQSIMLALEAMGGTATADDLATHIGSMIDQPGDVVKPEVSQVLRRGVANGFFQRRGKKYCLFIEGKATYDVDCGSTSARKRKRKSTDGGRSKRLRSNDDEEHDSELELEEKTIDDLQEIISRANEDTQKATLLATDAANRAKLASMKIHEIVDSKDGK